MPRLEHSSSHQPLAQLGGKRGGHKQELHYWNLIPYRFVLYLLSSSAMSNSSASFLRSSIPQLLCASHSLGCSQETVEPAPLGKPWKPTPFLTQCKLLLQPSWAPGQGQTSWTGSPSHAATSLTALFKVRISNGFVFRLFLRCEKKRQGSKRRCSCTSQADSGISFPFVWLHRSVLISSATHKWCLSMLLLHEASVEGIYP